MQIELKPCPFCGCKDFLKVEPFQFPPDEEGDAWQWGYNVVCDASGFEGTPRGCGASSPWQETPDEAVVSWNRRAIEAATPPDVAGLIEALLECAEMVEGGRQDGLTQFWHDETANLTAKTCIEAATALRLSAGGGVPEGWYCSSGERHTLLYTLRQDGWRKGKPLMVNDVTIRIEIANGSQTPIEPIVRLIVAALTASPAVEAGHD